MHIGSVTESVGVYVAAKITQKCIGLVRVVIMAWMLASVPVQYGLVGAATALMGVLTVVVSLGGNHGMVRYASQFFARGQLRALAGRSLVWLAAGTLLAGAGAMVASPAITTHLLVSREGGEAVGRGALLWLSWACIANAVLEANYRNLLGLLNGLRAYRLIAALELAFATMFTLSAAGALALSRTVLAVLLAHGVCVSVMIVLASVATGALVPRLQAAGASPDEEEQSPEGTGIATAGRLVRYGWPLVVSGLLGLVLQYASFYLVYRRFGQARAGVLWFFVQVSQLVLFIAQAAWAVVLTHVIARWEQGRRVEAMALLRLASKGLSLVLTSVAVAMYVSSPLWTSVLPGRFREGGAYLPGLLMFFQMLSNIAAVNVLARVHERPIVSPILSGAALVANVLLAWWWMGPLGPVGASWAAGTAMVGVGAVLGGGYLLLSRARLGWAAGGLMMSPMVLLAPRWLAVLLWAGVLVVAWRGGVLSAGERKTLSQLWNRLARRLPARG
jgi:O-antigen/teichoic acid export membrane protein